MTYYETKIILKIWYWWNDKLVEPWILTIQKLTNFHIDKEFYKCSKAIEWRRNSFNISHRFS
jgi:hypothetical protein